MSFSAFPTKSTIPTAHERLDWQRLDEFAQWMDGQLQQLENDFAHFVTTQSTQTSLKDSRGRQRGAQ